MTSRKPRTVLFRRRREQKTNYQSRFRLLKSDKKRLVVRFTNKRIIAEIVKFEMTGDKVLFGTDSAALGKFGWNFSQKSYPAAYLLGLIVGKEASKKGITDAILDAGFDTPLPKGRTYALLKGVLDGGLRVPHGEKDIFPSEERISGKHISDYAASLRDKNVHDKKFSGYVKKSASPEKIVEMFNMVKQKILNGK